MSEEKEILESYDYTYSNEKGDNKTVTIRPWNMFTAPKCFKLIGQILKDIRSERPDIDFTNLTSNLDVILFEASEPAFKLLETSVAKSLPSADLKDLMNNTQLDGALEMLEAIVKLNFFQPNLAKKIQSLLGLLGVEEVEDEESKE